VILLLSAFLMGFRLGGLVVSLYGLYALRKLRQMVSELRERDSGKSEL